MASCAAREVDEADCSAAAAAAGYCSTRSSKLLLLPFPKLRPLLWLWLLPALPARCRCIGVCIGDDVGSSVEMTVLVTGIARRRKSVTDTSVGLKGHPSVGTGCPGSCVAKVWQKV